MKAPVSRKSSAVFTTVFVVLLAAACGQGKEAMLKGIVQDPAQFPVKNALVIIEGFAEGVHSDDQGRFEIHYVPGSFVLRASAPGYTVRRTPFNLTGSDVINLQPVVLVALPVAAAWEHDLPDFIRQNVKRAEPDVGRTDTLTGIDLTVNVTQVVALDPVPGGNPLAQLAVHVVYTAKQRGFNGYYYWNPQSAVGIQMGDPRISHPLGSTWTSDFHIVVEYVPPNTWSWQRTVASEPTSTATPQAIATPVALQELPLSTPQSPATSLGGSSLLEADGRLNEVYQRLRAQLNERGKEALRRNEMNWLQRRDALTNKGDPSAVTRFINQRVQELKQKLIE